jgi:anti-sigma regulatory factor (Ser/Thr protein kinase)
VITAQQIRDVLGAGGQVVDPAGQHVGRILDVVLGAGTFQPAWVTVDCAPSSSAVVVVPLAEAIPLGGCLQVPYTADDVCGAPGLDGDAGRLTARRAEELGRHFDHLDGHPDRANGHRRATAGPPALVAVLPGLGMRTGRDAPVAYPGTASGPWPSLSTASEGPPWWRRCQWRWPSLSSSVGAMRLELRPFLDASGLPADELDDLTLAASEAAADAVEHTRLSAQRYFDVLTEVGEDWAGVVVQDHGRWRAPDGGGDRGRGLYLLSVLADATLSVGARGTTVVLRNRPASSG